MSIPPLSQFSMHININLKILDINQKIAVSIQFINIFTHQPSKQKEKEKIQLQSQHAFYPLYFKVFFIISHILFLSTWVTLPPSSSKWHYPPPPTSFPKTTNTTVSHSNLTIGQPSYKLFLPYKQGMLYTMALPLI